jgi:hypothetical protein
MPTDHDDAHAPDDERRLPPGLAAVVDARLGWLLSLGEARLEQLWRDERAQLDRLGSRAERIRRTEIRSAADAAAATRRLDALARQVPNQLTAGISRAAGGGFEFSVVMLTSDRGLAHEGLRTTSVRGPMRGKDGSELYAVTAHVTAEALRALAPRLRAAELARPWRVQLDGAVPAAQLDALASSAGTVTGRDVVVGVIDISALDFYHQDFRDPSPPHRTRVAFLWDQTLEPPAAEIDEDLSKFDTEGLAYTVVAHKPPTPPLSGVEGHGTAVTSCAAGNGAASDGLFRGAAPEADIIYVRLHPLDPVGVTVSHIQVLHALGYVFERAESLSDSEGNSKRGCVVSMSLGDLQGPHDGTTVGELFLDILLAQPGRAAAVPAGNWNGSWRHARGQVVQGQDTDLLIEFGGGARSSDALEVWYAGGDTFYATLLAPDGSMSGMAKPNQAPVEWVLPNGVVVVLVSRAAVYANGDSQIAVIVVVPPGQKIPLGTWTLRLHGTLVHDGRFQAWLDRNNPYSNFPPPFRHENEGTLGVPGTAVKAISVGSHRRVAGAPSPSGFSGRGPTRDDRRKPDILATGEMMTVAAALNRNEPPGADSYVHGRYGTSYATPLAAGACALLFECLGPTATADELKTILLDRAGLLASGHPGKLQAGTACP